MPYSVPVSEHMEECSVIPDDLDSLLGDDCISEKVSESPVQGAIPPTSPTQLWACTLHTPPAPSPQLPPAFFSFTVSQMSALETTRGDQTSTQVLDALGAFSLEAGDTEGKGGAGIGGLDSLSDDPEQSSGNVLVLVCVSSTAVWPHGVWYPCVLFPYSSLQVCGIWTTCTRRKRLTAVRGTCCCLASRTKKTPRHQNNFLGAFVFCKEVQERQECQYGENCTFAYCQEEIYLWTQERKGALRRELLFDPLGSTERRALSVTLLLQQHMGMFMFLCEVGCDAHRPPHGELCSILYVHTQSVSLSLPLQDCFDSKPPIISKCSKENLAVCSNLTARHPFDDKCLVHVVCSANVRHSKVRPLHPLCQFDMSPRGALRLPARGQLLLCPLRHRTQVLGAAAGHRYHP
ncbi:unnamed protein product [Oncorhynchus mykiss]|uniref:C3H1-type domain-containing protein n=1 Tax=Oncorhynchus mykiss TaxID=8022 RepID=A0A060XM16_ONCMY|nr:unnamed protein product [Oncorhynchus mykiss]